VTAECLCQRYTLSLVIEFETEKKGVFFCYRWNWCGKENDELVASVYAGREIEKKCIFLGLPLRFCNFLIVKG
jgi:hypothetical protein